jgi:hypothetical protein
MMTDKAITRLRQRLAGWLVLRGWLWIAVFLGVMLLGVVVLDAALDLPEAVRVAVPVGMGVLVLVGIVWLVVTWRQLTDARVARRFEAADPKLGTRLTNAVQLSGAESPNAIGEYLRREAVALGRQAAAGVAAGPVVRPGLVRAAVGAVLLTLAWAVLIGLEPGLWRAVRPRLTDPRGDHPPFSRLQFDVKPAQAEVLYGGNVEVRAVVSGIPVDRLWLVARTASNETRASMFLATDKTFFQTLANLREPTEYYVTDGRARSRRFPIRLRYTPQITLVEVTTEFPSYTGRPARTVTLADEAKALPADTVVKFRVASNRPLREGTLTLTPVLGGKPRDVQLTTESSANVVAGQFTLTEATAFAVAVRDTEGLAGAETRSGRFNVLPDERPRLFVLEPGRDAVATPFFKVPVRVQASDDYGVTRVVWLRGHNRSIERPFSLPVEVKNGPQSVEAKGVFDLEQLGVLPGDVIEYYFEAVDNWPAGPHVTLSKLYRLEVISLEQYQTILRAAAARKALFEPYLALTAWLRRLAERARNAEFKLERDGAAGQPAAMKEVALLAKDLAKFREELGKLLAAAPMFDVEEAFHATLQDVQERTRWVADRFEDAIGEGRITVQRLGQIGDQLHELVKREDEEVGEPARRIAAVVRLLAKADEVVKLARQQAELARLLQRFAAARDLARLEQMEVQELAHQQRRIQQAWQELLGALPPLVAALPATEEFNQLRQDVNELLTAAANLEIDKELLAAVEKLAALNPRDAHPPATAAAEKMAQLIDEAQKMPGDAQAALRFKPGLQQALGRTVEQILGAMGVGEGDRDGYRLFDEDVALYGPNVEMAGQQVGRGAAGDDAKGTGRERLTGAARDPEVKRPDVPARVRLQPDAKFPLRYRELVGEYFRAIAESGEERDRR